MEQLSTTNYDFAGWATCSGKLCSDGRTIMPDAFKHQDGTIVPLVWNHQHNDPNNILGKALLHSRNGGMYAYCQFNDTDSGQTARSLVSHGDICALSINAGRLKHNDKRGVIHGQICEVSLVLAGANPGAYIESVIKHGEESEEEAIMYFVGYPDTEEDDSLEHAEETKTEKENTKVAEETKKTTEETKETEGGETVAEIFDTLSEKQKTAVYVIVDQAVKDAKGESNDDNKDVKHSEGDNENMKTNVFDQTTKNDTVLSHADQQAIINMAKSSSVGSLQEAIRIYLDENESLSHGFVDDKGNEAIESLFPDFKNVQTGAPDTLKRDLSWVDAVMNKVHKSPYSRIRTRNADARIADLRAKGYQKKGDEKTISGNIKLLSRTTDPQTVYRKDQLNRDDIIDITEFDVVAYQWGIMKENMKEDLALAIMIGDGREDGDPDKIHETHIRSIWNDDDFYTIHQDVDVKKAREELQGTDTDVHFGDNYIYAEALITAALYSREQYKGSGALELYCAPHLLNVMLLARDLNGRRIYSSKADLAAALNVTAIHTAEQFEGKVRTTSDGKKKKLLGLFVNLNDYQVGCTKGGELTKFEDFDIDFNQYKYLLETRLSGAPIRPYSAIALEEDVTDNG